MGGLFANVQYLRSEAVKWFKSLDKGSRDLGILEVLQALQLQSCVPCGSHVKYKIEISAGLGT